MLIEKVQEFSEALAATPFSIYIQSSLLIIPAVQTIHILCVAAVISGVLMMNLRLLGLFSDQSMGRVAKRFSRYLWIPLLILLLSGALLIVAEPNRALLNEAFILKMLMLMTVVVLTRAISRPLRQDASYWERSPRRRLNSRLIALGSLALWVGIVFAGRLIAYVSSS